jgi:hypothetical protein
MNKCRGGIHQELFEDFSLPSHFLFYNSRTLSSLFCYKEKNVFSQYQLYLRPVFKCSFSILFPFRLAYGLTKLECFIHKNLPLSVVDSSVGRALSFSHEGYWFKSQWGHLFFCVIDPPSNWLLNWWASMVDRFYIYYRLMLEPIGRMTKTLNRTMYVERDHLKIV